MRNKAEIDKNFLAVTRKGSAFLVAVGVLSVLVLMILFFSNTRTARRWSTRLMSNESKAEAMAEAAVVVGLRLVGDQMNDPAGDWYRNLRVPGKLANSGTELSNDEGLDISMTLPDTENLLGEVKHNTNSGNDYLESLKSLMQDNGSWTVRLSARIASAAAMAAMDDDGSYHVTGINKEPVKPLVTGDISTVGRFIETISAAAGSNTGFTTLMSNYRLNIMLPPNHPQVSTTGSFEVSKKILFFKIKLKGRMTLTLVDRVGVPFTGSVDQAADHIEITGYIDLVIFPRIDFPLPGQPPLRFKIYKDILAPILERTPPYMEKFSTHGLLEKITGNADWKSYYWSDAKCLNYLKGAWNTVKTIPGVPSDWQSDLAVEKTGAVQIKAEVFYEPQEGRLIRRTLAAERPFKISDIQPVAPEYVFFVNNSNDSEIKFIGLDPGGITASSSIHPIPRQDSSKLDFRILEKAFGGATTDDKTHVPGMIRINGTKKMSVALFTGALEEAHTTHYNALMNDESSRIQLDANNKIDPRFNWLKQNNPLSMETVYIPLEPTLPSQPAETFQERGLVNMWDILKESKLSMLAPTALFGDYMHEYPFNLQLEGYLVQRLSRISLEAEVSIDGDKAMDMMNTPAMPDPPPDEIDGDIDPDNIPPEVADVFANTTLDFDIESLREIDKSEIKIIHKRIEEPYGVRINQTKATNATFAPSNPRSLPPALYSDLQYAKKAKYYYETATEFLNDFTNPATRDFKLDGVTFINESITLPAMTVKGKGLIVSRLNVTVTGNISRADDETVFGLIARNGAIIVENGVRRIEAACYSDKTLMNTALSPLIIDGNLVMDEFKRELFNSVSVIYNGPACRTTFLSVVRDVGKYDPARYHAVLGKQWSRYEYEKR